MFSISDVDPRQKLTKMKSKWVIAKEIVQQLPETALCDVLYFPEFDLGNITILKEQCCNLRYSTKEIVCQGMCEKGYLKLTPSVNSQQTSTVFLFNLGVRRHLKLFDHIKIISNESVD